MSLDTRNTVPASGVSGDDGPPIEILFGVVNGESLETYQDYYNQIRSAIAPKDIFEEFTCLQILHLQWDAMRLQRLNRHPPDALLVELRLLPKDGIGKAKPLPMRPDRPEAGRIGAARAASSDIVLAKTHLSLGFRWYA